jgi:Signal transduction histidine kinase
MLRRVQIFVRLAAAVLWALSGAASAQSTLPLQGDEVSLAAALSYALDDGSSLADQAARYRDGAFTPDLDTAMTGWSSYQPVWAAVTLTNPLPADGRAGDPWHITSQVYGIIALDAYLLREDGRTENLLAYDVRRPFRSGDFSGLRLRSDAALLSPGETAILMLRMTFGPVREAAFRAETPDRVEARTFLSGIGNSTYYAFALSCVLFFGGFALALRSGIALAYAGLLLAGLAFLAYLDLLFFRFLYPAQPALHLPLGIGLLDGIAGGGLLVAAHQSRHPRHTRAFRLAGLAALALALVQPALPSEATSLVAYALCCVMLVANLLAVADSRASPADRSTRGLFLAASLATLALLAAFLAGRLGGWLDPALLVKAIFGTIALWVIGINSLGLVELRRAHSLAQSREISALRAEAEAQEQYLQARDLAARRQRRLADASHDLRQPLASLRMTMDRLARQGDPALRKQLAGAFDYMEDLARTYLDEGHGAADPDPQDRPEPVPLSLVIATAQRLFDDQARAQGLTLRLVSSNLQVTAPAMPLLRIVTNLVSNAIRHGRTGKVLMGVRRKSGHALLTVADQGPGMTKDDLAAFRQIGIKGDASEGDGLGLPICFAIAQSHGWTLTATSHPGRGTCFRLALPLAEEPT